MLQHHVAVVGAGPAGLYAAKTLSENGVSVSLFNRDIKPGGLAEYGIYHDKHKMKEGLRKQFRSLLHDCGIRYYGNVTIGTHGDLSLDDLRGLGFDAILVTAGAQGTKWLGLPGEELTGVYHAKDLVYHYNLLPPYSQQDIHVGRDAVIVGVGNVMMDIAHWLIREKGVETVMAVARRGPAEVKFDKGEMKIVGANLDLKALEAELERCRPVMEAVGQSVDAAREEIMAGVPGALDPVTPTRFLLQFLASPTAIVGENGVVTGLEVEETTLVKSGDEIKARGLGTKRVIPTDMVVFAIGDKVDPEFGLPIKWNAFVKDPNPRFPIEGNSYEAFDPEANAPVKGVFVAGWSREASTGLVGVARKDGTDGAKAVVGYLKTVTPAAENVSMALDARLSKLNKPIVSKEAWASLEAVEAEVARERGLSFFKYSTNEEMLDAIARHDRQPA